MNEKERDIFVEVIADYIEWAYTNGAQGMPGGLGEDAKEMAEKAMEKIERIIAEKE